MSLGRHHGGPSHGSIRRPRGRYEILHETGRDIPFIVASGSIGEELAVTLMKAGAHDYVLKDNLARLAPAVDREIREARTRRERNEAEKNLRDSEERLALAIQATQLGTFDYLPRTGKLIWSELTRRHFGLPPAPPSPSILPCAPFIPKTASMPPGRCRRCYSRAATVIGPPSSAPSAPKTAWRAGYPPGAAPSSMRRASQSASSASRSM